FRLCFFFIGHRKGDGDPQATCKPRITPQWQSVRDVASSLTVAAVPRRTLKQAHRAAGTSRAAVPARADALLGCFIRGSIRLSPPRHVPDPRLTTTAISATR